MRAKGNGLLVLLIFGMGLMGCSPAYKHASDVGRASHETDRITVGRVQREIRIGMPSAEVIEALGSPNIVTTDEERREVWVYDKISTISAYSSDRGSLFLLLAGVEGQRGAHATTQATLTIIIKFDHDGRVRDFSYHSSKF